MSSIEQTFKISVQTVKVICPCGGTCENENGFDAIGYFDNVVWCAECQGRFEVPATAFEKKEVTI